MPAPVRSQPPACLDIEASGFGRDSYPIEIGCVLPDGQAWCTLIRPLPDWTHWDDAAQLLHGIDRATLLRHGRPVTEVALELNQRLAGRTVYCDGWAHDYSWLARLYDAAECAPSFQLGHLRSLLSESEAAAWQVARRNVDDQQRLQRHRASHDARLIQLTWSRLRAQAEPA